MKNEERFFSQIEEVLHSYEEAYIPGAWEEFRKEKKRKRGMFLIWLSGAAAVLLLFSYIAAQFFISYQMPDKVDQANIRIHKKTTDSVKIDNNATSDHKAIAMDKTAVKPDRSFMPAETTASKQTRPFMEKGNDPVMPVNPVVTTYNESPPAVIEPKTIPDNGLKQPVTENPQTQAPVAAETKKIEKITRPVYDSIAGQLNTGKKYIVGNTKPDAPKLKERNLAYAIVVSPSVGNQNVNFGTGVEVAYRISGNLFVSSGVAYNSIHASANKGGASLSSNQAQAVNLAVSGFEVPIGLQYKTKSGFYASAGVLAMTVVQDRLEYNYITDRRVSASLADANGLYQQQYVVVPERKNESSPERVNRYLGFYNLSVGKKTTIGNNQFNIGPFVKIPFGGVSSENIKLLQGGIHLGFGF